MDKPGILLYALCAGEVMNGMRIHPYSIPAVALAIGGALLFLVLVGRDRGRVAGECFVVRYSTNTSSGFSVIPANYNVTVPEVAVSDAALTRVDTVDELAAFINQRQSCTQVIAVRWSRRTRDHLIVEGLSQSECQRVRSMLDATSQRRFVVPSE